MRIKPARNFFLNPIVQLFTLPTATATYKVNGQGCNHQRDMGDMSLPTFGNSGTFSLKNWQIISDMKN